VVPLHTDAGPLMVGVFGVGFTVTLYGPEAAVQVYELPTVTLTVWAPGVFHVTVIVFVPAPPVIVPPAETVQVYVDRPDAVEYVTPVTPAHTVVFPVITGVDGVGLTVITTDEE